MKLAVGRRNALLGAGFFVLANMAITQVLAYRVDMTALWGDGLAGWHWPWRWLVAYPDLALAVPRELTLAMGTGGVVFAVGTMLIVVYGGGVAASQKGIKDLHGSARWANSDDLDAMGLLDQSDGVYVGGWQAPDGTCQYLRHDGVEPICAVGPPRCGKGAGLIVPTLLSWRHSTLVLDIKGENWALTAGWR